MTYTVMGKKDHSEDGVVIFATERQSHIQSILENIGLDTVYGSIPGEYLED